MTLYLYKPEESKDVAGTENTMAGSWNGNIKLRIAEFKFNLSKAGSTDETRKSICASSDVLILKASNLK